MIIDVSISPKALRETLCIAQTRIGNSGLDEHRRDQDIANLQALIDECDRHRPLGPDGKHGDRHTATCGCPQAMIPHESCPYCWTGLADRCPYLHDHSAQSDTAPSPSGGES